MIQKIKLLWSFMKGNRKLYIGATIAIGIAALFTYINPLVIKVTIDSIIGDYPIEVPDFINNIITFLGGQNTLARNLWICSLLIVSLTMISGIFSFFQKKWASVASESIAQKMRDKLFDHLQRLSFEYHIKAETGDLIQRCTSDVETIRKFLGIQLVEIGRTIFMILLALPIMFSLNLEMSLIAITIIPLLVGFSFVFFVKVQKAFEASDSKEGEMSTVLQENLTGMRVVRAFARQKYETEKFDKKNSEYKDLTYRLIILMAWYWSVTDLMSLVHMGVILVAGTYWAATGTIQLGTLVVFLSYENMLLWPIRELGRILADMGKSIVSIGRIKEILDVKPEDLEPGLSMQKGLKGKIEFKNVNFSYNGKENILNNISFKIEPGETVGILGPTGCGKTSLIHLIPKLYDYSSGSVKIDGIELSTIDKQWIRGNTALVLQEPFLFAKTIKDNISFGKKHIKEAEIFEASRAAAIHDVILEFDKGYDTPVGEKGVTLSGGQKQRVAIARALVKESPILILDDSLSAVDTETDVLIREALAKRKHKATTIIISHRLSTLSRADKIIVMEKGRIVQNGTHDQLIQKDGLYKQIWLLQNSLEDELKLEMDSNTQNKTVKQKPA